MSTLVDVEEELALFDRALIVYTETKLLGLRMHEPPKEKDACWVHSTDRISLQESGDEYWVRLQCYRSPLMRRGGGEGVDYRAVMLWTMFAVVRLDQFHPLVQFYNEVVSKRTA